MIAIIGHQGIDPTGLAYESVLKSRGGRIAWFDIAELAKSIVLTSGENLDDYLNRDPFLLEATASDFRLHADAPIRGAVGAIVVDVQSRYEPCEHLIAFVLDDAGIALTNPPEAVRLAADKWFTHEALTAAGLPRPHSALVTSADDAPALADEFGFPLVVKARTSSQGKGVSLVRDLSEFVEAIDVMKVGGQPLMVEQYVECHSADKRVLIVDGKVRTGRERVAKDGEFRANLALGGHIGDTSVVEDEAEIVIAGTQALGMSFAGMDIARVAEVLPGREHLQLDDLFFVEANAAPGLKEPQIAPGAMDMETAGVVVELLLRNVARLAANDESLPVSRTA